MELNVITLSVPYPPDYGGMIDSYYRIKWLKAAGVNIHLHCFQYGRPGSKELEMLCDKVYYYPRYLALFSLFSKLPFIVGSRKSKQLLRNLKSNDYPILFDGIHTTYCINHPDLAGRKISVRAHNVEHFYYKSLADFEKNPLKKLYLRIESRKLKRYEERIRSSVNLLTISGDDFNYFSGFNKNVFMLPPFHQYAGVISNTGKGEYVLYHGDLSVPENAIVARFLINNVFPEIEHKCIIAGKNPPANLIREAGRLKNLRLIADPDQSEMEDLIRKAHINLLPVLTSNGFKMKHLIALFSGRYCLINSTGARNFDDKFLFHTADSPEEIKESINYLMEKEFTSETINMRKKLLEECFSNISNAQKLAEHLTCSNPQ